MQKVIILMTFLLCSCVTVNLNYKYCTFDESDHIICFKSKEAFEEYIRHKQEEYRIYQTPPPGAKGRGI